MRGECSCGALFDRGLEILRREDPTLEEIRRMLDIGGPPRAVPNILGARTPRARYPRGALDPP
jgi:hypothetical protein